MKFQIEYVGDEAVCQAVPYQTQLVVPKVDLLAVSVVYDPPTNAYVVHKMPIFAVRETITERWLKEGIENPKDESEYHNANEFEEAGYKFKGRESDTEFLFIDRHQFMMSIDGGGIMKLHDHERMDDHDSPITQVETLAVCYKDQAEETVKTLRKEVLAHYRELREEDEHEGSAGDE